MPTSPVAMETLTLSVSTTYSGDKKGVQAVAGLLTANREAASAVQSGNGLEKLNASASVSTLHHIAWSSVVQPPHTVSTGPGAGFRK